MRFKCFEHLNGLSHNLAVFWSVRFWLQEWKYGQHIITNYAGILLRDVHRSFRVDKEEEIASQWPFFSCVLNEMKYISGMIHNFGWSLFHPKSEETTSSKVYVWKAHSFIHGSIHVHIKHYYFHGWIKLQFHLETSWRLFW